MCADAGLSLGVCQADLGDATRAESDDEAGVVCADEIHHNFSTKEAAKQALDCSVALLKQTERLGRLDILPVGDAARCGADDKQADSLCVAVGDEGAEGERIGGSGWLGEGEDARVSYRGG